MAQLSVRLFGPFEATLDGAAITGFASDKVRALLAYLAIEANRPHRRERLAGLLWPDYPDVSARTSLRRALANLRDVIGDREAETPVLEITRQTVQFNPASDSWLDVADFYANLKGDSEGTTNLVRYEKAIELYRGLFLESFSIPDSAAFEEWALETQQALQEEALRALHWLAENLLDAGRFDTALRYAQQGVDLDPYREEARSTLMKLLARNGQRTHALAEYKELKELLMAELGVEPSAGITALYNQIGSGEFEMEAKGVGLRVIRGYEVREKLGEGHFGVVYRAYQPAVGRDVALKVILPEYADNLDFVRSFEAEAQIVARLEHPYIVPLYDYWREPGGAYLVMRWLRGGNLAAHLAQGPWSPEAAVRLVDQVALGLAMAHRQGVVHRDIKPANILLDEEGNAYLTDFGITTLTGPLVALWANRGPAAGEISPGSLGYISPELAQGAEPRPAADIYSFGVVLYELLTGQVPFPGMRGEVLLEAHIHKPLPSIKQVRPGLPAAVDAVVAKATAKDPASRYPDTLALAAAFREALAVETSPQVSVIHEGIANPYKGLRPFEEGDADDFFGREALVERLLKALAPSQKSIDGNGKDGTPKPEDARQLSPGVERRPISTGPGGEAARFLAVVGPSGSGKSSVVKAGLLPALRRGALRGSQNWFISEMTPAIRPFEELEAALLRVAINPPESLLGQLRSDERGLLRAVKRILPRGTGTELLLVIDQFEELFNLLDDENERRHFLESLYHAVMDSTGYLHVVVTLRADYYDRPLGYAGFAELVREHTEVVLPLSPEELEQAIAAPAKRVGVSIEAGVVADIVAETVDQPGALPLLQYALTELFEGQEEGRIKVDAYRSIGGVLGALGRRAEALYAGLDADGKEACRQMFLRLVALGEGAEDARRRVLRGELEIFGVEDRLLAEDGSLETSADPQQLVRGRQSAVNMALDLFGKYRLLTFNRDEMTRAPTVEIAHEALLRKWDRLEGWIEESRGSLRMQRQLHAAAVEWEEARQDPSYLLQGTRLSQFESWALETDLVVNPLERTYLETSLVAQQEREATEEVQRVRERELERRNLQRLRVLVAVLVAASVVGITLTLAVLNQNRIARQNEAQARSLALAANSRLAFNAGEADLAIALALESNRIDNPPAQAQLALADAAYAPGTRRLLEGHESRHAYSLSFSPDGTRALTGGQDRSMILWDLRTGEPLQRYGGFRGSVTSVEYSPEGQPAVLGILDGSLRRIDLETGDEIGRMIHSPPFVGAALSPEGRSLLWITDDGRLTLLDIESRSALREFGQSPGEDLSHSVSALTYRPDGDQALTGHVDGQIVVWDLASGEEIRRFGGESTAIEVLAITPDGSQVLTANANGEVTGWDTSSGALLWTYEPKSIIDKVYRLVVMPDGSSALFGAMDGGLRLWDLQAGEEVARLGNAGDTDGHAGWVTALAVSADGRKALSGGTDGQLILWDLELGEATARFEAAPTGPGSSPLLSLALSPDGTQVVTGYENGLLALWDLQSGEVLQEFEGDPWNVESVAYFPDGKSVLAATIDGWLSRWNFEEGLFDRLFHGPRAEWVEVSLSEDGQTASSNLVDVFGTSEVGDVLIWDVGKGQIMNRLSGHHVVKPSAAAMSPDGSRALSGDETGRIVLWDILSGESVYSFNLPFGNVHDLAFSSNGALAIISCDGAGLVILDIESGEVLQNIPAADFAAAVAFSPDGRIAYAGLGNGEILLWDIDTDQALDSYSAHKSSVLELALAPDGRSALSSTEDGVVRVWDLSPGPKLGNLDPPGEDFGVSLSPDGKHALTGADGDLIYWDMETGKALRILHGDRFQPIYDIAISPDGRRAVTSSWGPEGAFDGDSYDEDPTSLILWDIETGGEIRRFNSPFQLNHVAITPDGRYAVVGSGFTADEIHGVYVWDLETGEMINPFPTDRGETVYTVDISPDGSTVLFGYYFSHDNAVELRDLATGDLLRSFPQAEGAVLDLAYLPDGKHAVTVSWDDRRLILWDLETGEIVHSMSGLSTEMTSVDVDPNGRFALTGMADGRLILWDLRTGEAIRNYWGHDGGVAHVIFTPEGDGAVSSSGDGTVPIWHIQRTVGELVDWVLGNRYVRDLTCEERAFYQVEPLCEN